MPEQPALHLPDYFPTMRYHPTEPAQMVMAQEELDALDALWRDTPYSPEEMAAAKEAAEAHEAQRRSPDEPEPRSHHRSGR